MRHKVLQQDPCSRAVVVTVLQSAYFGGDVHEATQQSDCVLHVGLVVVPNRQLAEDVVHVCNLNQPPLQ